MDNTARDIHQPEKLLDLMQYTKKRFGCSVLLLDNLMTVSLPGEDKYNAQSAFVGDLVELRPRLRRTGPPGGPPPEKRYG